MASRKALLGLAAAAAVTAIALTSCSAGGGGSDSATPSGDITFLTNRTDLQQDGTFAKYIKEFRKTYPDVNVKVEGITNYADDVKTRLSSPNGYGDVLLIPSVPPDQFSDFFEPLGKTSKLAATYRFLSSSSYDGTQYGIALGGNANGILYNKSVWKQAGITDLPTSSDEFLADLKKIKDNTSAIPLYTNYKDGWPLTWTSEVGAPSGDPDALNKMAHDKAPWTKGTDIYTINSLLFDAVHQKLTEPDPLTTNWEQSKGEFATGKIATMVLGSWAISQFQAAAKTAGTSPDDVGFMAWPATAHGKQYATIGGDYNLAINKNSSHKAAAKAWMNWLLEKSGFTNTQGMISSIKSAPLPSNLRSLSDAGVTLLEMNPAPKGEESLLNNIADKSQVDVWGYLYVQKMIDIARGQAPGDKASYFAQLNQQWGDAVEQLAK